MYATGDGASAIHTEVDTPHTFDVLDEFTEMRTGMEKFRTWLMFRPPGGNSRYVPTKIVHWRWGGKAVKTNGVWSAAIEPHEHRTAASATTEHPQWEDNAIYHQGDEAADPAITISFTVPSVTEGDGIVNGQATVSVPANVSADLNVNLLSSSPDRLTVPATVTISSGSHSVGFSLTVIDNADQDGDRTVRVFGQATDHTTGNAPILVKDND